MPLIPCQKHEGSYLLFIKYQKEKTEYLCEECCIELEKSGLKIEYSKLIYIKKALKSPEFLLSKLNLENDLIKYFDQFDIYNEKNLNNILKDFKTKIENIQNTLQAVYKEIEQHVKFFLELKQKIKDKLKEIINYDQFKQLPINLEQLGDTINPQAIEQNEKILHQYLQDLTKNDSKELIQTLNIMVNSIKLQPKDQNLDQYPQFQTLLEYFKIFTQSQQEFKNQMELIYDSPKIESSLLQPFYKRKLNSIIQQKLSKQIKIYQQIYLGTRDGLNSQSFWNKINGKSNLLMIFKSKSGYIFGAFSPCQWQSNLNNHVQDNTLSSFIFSQTHDQIYPLKEANKQQYAIYCWESNGPTLGGGYDLYIQSDFNGGYSNLGYSYQWDQYQNTNSTHLFGQSTPNIAECEIFMLTFG